MRSRQGNTLFFFFFHIIFSHFIIGGKYCLYLERQQLVSCEKAIHRLTCQMYYQFISLDWEPKGILIVLTLIREEKKLPSFSSWTCDLNTDLVCCSVKRAPAAPPPPSKAGWGLSALPEKGVSPGAGRGGVLSVPGWPLGFLLLLLRSCLRRAPGKGRYCTTVLLSKEEFLVPSLALRYSFV